MNWGINALGQGNRANSTIGRAVNLVIRGARRALAVGQTTNAADMHPTMTPKLRRLIDLWSEA